MNPGYPVPTSSRMLNPWIDLSMAFAPRNMRSALYLAEYLYNANGSYSSASRAIVSYFITSLDISGQADDEVKKFSDVLIRDLKINSITQEIGEDKLSMGNSFSSVMRGIRRVLRCGVCSCEVAIEKTDFDFRMTSSEIIVTAHCKKCHMPRRHYMKDFPNYDTAAMSIRRWDPKRISINYNELTGDCDYYYQLPEDVLGRIRSGDPFYLRTTPIEFIAAAHKNQRFRFDKKHIYHMKESTLAGIRLNGWGMPPIFHAFRNMFRLQVMLRHDEALMTDYIVPIRVISPKQGQYVEGNTIQNTSMAKWTGKVEEMIRRHRIDSTDFNIFPFPMEYQALGGEGRQLVVKDLIDYEEKKVLNIRGIPPEIYTANLTLQASPVALRLFERRWTSIVNDFNGWLQWVSTTVSRYSKTGDIKASWMPVTLADDLEAKAFRAQLAQAGLISKETAFRPMGIDVKKEVPKKLQEEIYEQQETQKAQQDMQMQQMALGGQNESGEGQGGGQSSSGSPLDVEAQGDEMARQLLAPNVPESVRRQQLGVIRNQNPTLHAIVIKKMDQIRNRAGTAGQSAGMEQALQMPLPGSPQQ